VANKGKQIDLLTGHQKPVIDCNSTSSETAVITANASASQHELIQERLEASAIMLITDRALLKRQKSILGTKILWLEPSKKTTKLAQFIHCVNVSMNDHRGKWYKLNQRQ
jgi:hypothetical protein